MLTRPMLAAASIALLGGCHGGAGAGVDAGDGIATWTGTVAWPMPNPPGSYDLSSADVAVDLVTGLGWQRAPGAGMYLWSEAGAACDALSLAGADDWRLPTLIELVSIVDPSRASPAVDPAAFPDTAPDSFWTSTPVAGAAGDAWYINFSTGFSYQGHQAFLPLYVRCVRTQRALAPRPGPTWQRVESADIFTFDGAGAHCAGLGGGWRLPTMKELQTIVDSTRAGPALDPAAFPGASSFPMWTSTPLAGSTTDAWTVDFYLGAAAPMDRGSTFRARCVR